MNSDHEENSILYSYWTILFIFFFLLIVCVPWSYYKPAELVIKDTYIPRDTLKH